MTAPFGRVLTAMVTPFDADGGIDPDAAARLAQHLVARGHDGLVVFGTTGESPTVCADEQEQVLRGVVAAVGGRASIVAGVGSYDTAHAVESARAAQASGVDGLLAVTPYYNKPPQAGLLAHFRAVADVSDIPVMLYDIPGRTATKIAADTLARLAEHPRIVAVKDATGDLYAGSLAAAVDRSGDLQRRRQPELRLARARRGRGRVRRRAPRRTTVCRHGGRDRRRRPRHRPEDRPLDPAGRAGDHDPHAGRDHGQGGAGADRRAGQPRRPTSFGPRHR